MNEMCKATFQNYSNFGISELHFNDALNTCLFGLTIHVYGFMHQPNIIVHGENDRSRSQGVA